MATHGDIWLPLDPNRPKSPMLYCEAWSDGYLDGVGYGALSSSAQISNACKLSALFAGSPVFYLPAQGVFQAKEEDALGETFSDFAMEAMVDEALAALARGDIQAALDGPLGATSLEQKIEKGYGLNAKILPCEEAWEEFLRNHCASETWESPESAERLALAHGVEETETGTGYCWREGQFWGVCSLDEDNWQAVPLIHLAALSGSRGCFGDLPGYLGEITDKDRASLLDLLNGLSSAGKPITGLFDGDCDAQVRSLYEAAALDKSVLSAAPTKRPGGL